MTRPILVLGSNFIREFNGREGVVLTPETANPPWYGGTTSQASINADGNELRGNIHGFILDGKSTDKNRLLLKHQLCPLFPV